MFRLADKEEHFEGRNPFAGRTLEETNSSWRSYKTEELTKLFSAPLLRDTPTEQRVHPAKYTFENAMARIPLVGLFSGMRSNEICQMRASDVQRKEGIWLFNVSDENKGQSLSASAQKEGTSWVLGRSRGAQNNYAKGSPRPQGGERFARTSWIRLAR